MTSSISFSKEIVTYLISHGREPLRFPISTSLDQFTPCRRKLTETWSLAMSTLIADLPHNIWKHPTSSRTEEEQAFLSYSIYIYIKMCHAPEMLASQIFPKMAVRPYHQQPPERYVGALRGRLELMLEDDHLSIQSKEFSGSSSWHFFCFFLNVDIFGHLFDVKSLGDFSTLVTVFCWGQKPLVFSTEEKILLNPTGLSVSSSRHPCHRSFGSWFGVPSCSEKKLRKKQWNSKECNIRKQIPEGFCWNVFLLVVRCCLNLGSRPANWGSHGLWLLRFA